MAYVKKCKRFLSTKVENREITEQKQTYWMSSLKTVGVGQKVW